MNLLLLGSVTVWAVPPSTIETSDAAADAMLGRRGERSVPQWYARLDDLGGPVRPRWRRRSRSTYRVWQFADGVVERSWRRARGEVVEERFYDVQGWASESVAWDDGRPVSGVVHLAEEVSLSLNDTRPQELLGASFFAPDPLDDGRFAWAGGQLRVWSHEGDVDVQDARYAQRWLEECGCRLVERQPVWIDGEPGVRLRLETLAVGAPDVAYLWAVPRDGHTWLASYLVTGSERPDSDLAAGRLVLRTVRWRMPQDANGRPP